MACGIVVSLTKDEAWAPAVEAQSPNYWTIRDYLRIHFFIDFPSGSDGKESTCNTGNSGLIPGSGRFPGEGNGNPLQYSC